MSHHYSLEQLAYASQSPKTKSVQAAISNISHRIKRLSDLVSAHDLLHMSFLHSFQQRESPPLEKLLYMIWEFEDHGFCESI